MVRSYSFLLLLKALFYRFTDQRRGDTTSKLRKEETFFGVGLCAISSFGLVRALLRCFNASFAFFFLYYCYDAHCY